MSNNNNKQDEILALKRQAVALKESGDTNGAMQLLAQARDLEFQDATVEDIWEPLKLKQLAVVLKKKGDLDTARLALHKAKQLEKGEIVPPTLQQAEPSTQPPPQQPAESQPQQSQEKAEENPIRTTTNDEIAAANDEQPHKQDENLSPTGTPANSQQVVEDPVEEHPMDDSHNADGDDGDEEDEGDLQALMQLGDNNNHDDDDMDVDILLTQVEFSMEEMIDQDMMTEFKNGGMPVPSEADYQAKILDAKKAALAFKKAGDTTRAVQELHKAKQLDAVRVALSQIANVDGFETEHAMMEHLNLNAEESELLGEVLNPASAAAASSVPSESNMDSDNNNNNNNTDRLENILEDLAGFMEDVTLFMDAVDMGMEVPSVDEIRAKAEEHKQSALDHKNAGNLEGAKASLLKFKQFTAHAAKLEICLEQMQQKKGKGTNREVKMEDLEALLDAEDQPKQVVQAKKEKAAGPKPKSSDELKQEAIRFRDQKMIKEAGEALKLYKEALQREQHEAEVQRRQQIVNDIRNEIAFAERQVQILEFYEHFVDAEAQQVASWKEYIARCSNVSKVVLAKGSDAIKIVRKEGSLMCVKPIGEEAEEMDVNDMITGLLGASSSGSADPPDERLEIAIMGVRKIDENTYLQKLVKQQKRDNLPHHPAIIRVDAHVQFPPNDPTTTADSIDLVFEPSADPLKKLQLPDGGDGGEEPQLPSYCAIEQSQYIHLERGDTTYGKAIRRRMERNKKIHISVHQVPVAPKKGGWFFNKKKKGDEDKLPPPTLLGKVVVELHGLLTRNCAAAGEFPLMNGSGTKALGGTVRLVVRTGLPLLPPEAQGDHFDGKSLDTTLTPHNAMVFSLNQPPPPEASTPAAPPEG